MISRHMYIKNTVIVLINIIDFPNKLTCAQICFLFGLLHERCKFALNVFIMINNPFIYCFALESIHPEHFHFLSEYKLTGI